MFGCSFHGSITTRDSGAERDEDSGEQPSEDADVDDVTPGTDGGTGGRDGTVSASCKPVSKQETECSDGADDDCDGFTDCLDPDCDSKSCDENGGTCLAGACLAEGALPELPRIDNVSPQVRGDTAIVDFSPVKGAKDYRVYVLPKESDVRVGANGQVAVQNAIYRCGGAIPRDDRGNDQIKALAGSLQGNVNGYMRTEADSVLGHVYLTPGEGREAIYRVANPNLVGGYAWETGAPPAKEFNGAEYVKGTAARDELLAKGFRDDGIAFYVPTSATRSVYRREYTTTDKLSIFYTDGPEKTVRDGQGGNSTGGERFKILAAPADGSVPLYRIHYAYFNNHDVLAAGDAYRERVLNQGNLPITSLMWPGLKGETTLVIEALDDGCPFPGGYVGAMAAPAADLGNVPSQPTITLDQARLSGTNEVYINGQYATTNRPKPIARAYVTVKPKPHPTNFDWFESFDPGSTLTLEKIVDDNIGTRVFRNDKLSIEYQATNANYSYGPMLGQLVLGSPSSFAVVAMNANAKIKKSNFLHATMSVDIASTNRRYPQILITDAPVGDPAVDASYNVPFFFRLGPVPADNKGQGKYHTIVVQTFSGQPELQVQLCDLRGWGVSAQCPMANVYGYHAGVQDPGWTQPWLPVPVLGDYAGMDRLVKFDVYASTDRVYVFVEDKPAGCAVLPAGRFPEGDVNVLFSIAAYHIEIDEFVERVPTRHQYWNRYSLAHTDRKMDDLGIKSGESLPPWDETVLPCGSRFYNGLL